MRKLLLIVGVTSMMAAIAVLGHDCQAWLDKGAWSSTTIGGALQMAQINYHLVDKLRNFELVRLSLNLPFYFVFMAIGIAGFLVGSINTEISK